MCHNSKHWNNFVDEKTPIAEYKIAEEKAKTQLGKVQKIEKLKKNADLQKEQDR